MGNMLVARADDEGGLGMNSRDRRLKFARETLRNQLLPHVGVNEGDEFKKAFFTGYMTNRLI